MSLSTWRIFSNEVTMKRVSYSDLGLNNCIRTMLNYQKSVLLIQNSKKTHYKIFFLSTYKCFYVWLVATIGNNNKTNIIFYKFYVAIEILFFYIKFCLKHQLLRGTISST